MLSELGLLTSLYQHQESIRHVSEDTQAGTPSHSVSLLREADPAEENLPVASRLMIL